MCESLNGTSKALLTITYDYEIMPKNHEVLQKNANSMVESSTFINHFYRFLIIFLFVFGKVENVETRCEKSKWNVKSGVDDHT